MVRALPLALGASLLAVPAFAAQRGLVYTQPQVKFQTETIPASIVEIEFDSTQRLNSTEFLDAGVNHVAWSFAPQDGQSLVFGAWSLNTDVPSDRDFYYQFFTYNKTFVDPRLVPYEEMTFVGNIQVVGTKDPDTGIVTYAIVSDVPVSTEPGRNDVVAGEQENPYYVAFPEDMAVLVEYRFTEDVENALVPLSFSVGQAGLKFGLPRDQTTGYVISVIAGISVLLTIFLLYKDREEIAGKRRDRIMKLRREEARRVQM